MPEVHLESLAFGGDAVGRLEGKVIFVPFGAPGDVVQVRILKEKASYCRAELVRVVTPAASRRTPLCPYFGSCGGCQWQHVLYEEQVRQKSEIFRQALSGSVAQFLPLIEAPAELAYRRRIRMHWQKEGPELLLGFYRRRSRQLLDVARCPLLSASLQRGLDRAREILSGLPSTRGTVVAICGAGGEVQLSLRLSAGHHRCARLLTEATWREPVVGGSVEQDGEGHAFGQEWINLASSLEPALWSSSRGFAQVNPEQERVLRQSVVQAAAARGTRVLELFAGIGTFTLALADEAREVVAVESNPVSAGLLRQNLGSSRGRTTVLIQPAEKALAALARRGERFDVVVLDPPREGCPAVCEELVRLGPERVVYVSCDPMTLARDLCLLQRHGLRPQWALALDMMPQTFHVEGVVVLHRC